MQNEDIKELIRKKLEEGWICTDHNEQYITFSKSNKQNKPQYQRLCILHHKKKNALCLQWFDDKWKCDRHLQTNVHGKITEEELITLNRIRIGT